MKALIEKTERLADRASLFVASIAAVVLLGLVALTCADVIGRYFFTAPVIGAVELVRLCMAGIIFLSVPLMFLRNDHVIVDLFTFLKRGWLGWVVTLAFLLITIWAAVTLGDRVWDYAIRALEDGDTTEYLGIPRYPFVALITLAIYSAAVMAGLRFVVLLMRGGREFDDQSGGEL